ncbi:MAG TPA: TRAP transporter substrate-binding protein [Patescibacteria group bacterium]|nr:TRAP transporter substrate-binding protein [Patescibacteria group bacterium]
MTAEPTKLKWMVMIGLLSLCFASCGREGKTIVIKVAHNGSVNHPHQVGFDKFKEVLEQETAGRIEVQIFPNSQLGSEEEASQLVKLGLLSASAASSGGGLASFVPEAELFNLPFIFDDLNHFYRVLDGPVGDRVARAIENKLNCVVLGYWFSGIRNVWNSKKPVLKPEDLNDLKIRVMSSPILLETFNALGAQATPMAFGELYTALQMGVVDGGETDHIDLLFEKFHEVTRYVSYTNHMFLAVALIFSKKQFERLPADVRQAVLNAGRASVKAQRLAMESRTASALEELKRLGLKFFEVDKNLFREKVKSVYLNNAEKVGGMGIIEMVKNQ